MGENDNESVIMDGFRIVACAYAHMLMIVHVRRNLMIQEKAPLSALLILKSSQFFPKWGKIFFYQKIFNPSLVILVYLN